MDGSLILLPIGIGLVVLALVAPKKKTEKRMKSIEEEYSNLIDRANEYLIEYNTHYNFLRSVSDISEIDIKEINAHVKTVEELCVQMQEHLDNMAEAINSNRDRVYCQYQVKCERTLTKIAEIAARMKVIREQNDAYREWKRKNLSGSEKEQFASEMGKTTGYFCCCKTKTEIKKRYKELAKIYHPDMPEGDVDVFRLIKKEYEERMLDEK